MALLKHWALNAVVAGALGGCATVRPTISNPAKFGLQLTDTDYHVFTRLSLEVVDQELVIHGEVAHRHGTCATEAHVDLALADGSGRAVRAESLPLRPGRLRVVGRMQSWSAPSFEARLKPTPSKGSRIVMTFHDSGCSQGGFYDCGENAAVPGATAPVSSDRK